MNGQSVNQLRVDREVSSHADSQLLESVFKQLWDRIRAATELISHLREENKTYGGQAERLEGELVQLRAELNQKEQEIKRLKVDHAHLEGALGDNEVLTIEEKESLKGRIKDLISKINSHL